MPREPYGRQLLAATPELSAGVALNQSQATSIVVVFAAAVKAAKRVGA
jgi:hypothetical protein